MTILAGTTWIARMINRWRAQDSMGALLRRMDDHHLDDIGVTRGDLQRAFGEWPHDRTWITAQARVASASFSRGAVAAAAMPTLLAIAGRSRNRSQAHGHAACSAH